MGQNSTKDPTFVHNVNEIYATTCCRQDRINKFKQLYTTLTDTRQKELVDDILADELLGPLYCTKQH